MRGKVFRSGGLFRSVQLLLLAVLVGSFLAPALPAQQASAKRLSEVDNLRTQARIWSEYQLLAAKKCKWGNPDRAAIDRPSWFSGTANAGLLIEDKDGKMECKNSTWLSEVVGTLSGSSDFYAVFDKIKYDNGINPPPGQFPSKVNNVPAYLRQFVDLSDSEVKAAKYVILFNAFTSPSGCSAKPLSGTATPSNQTKYVIKTADGGKQVKDVPYVIDNGKRGDAVRVGFGFGSADGGGDGAIKCENIASLLKSSDLANAVVAWKTAHPNSEVDLGSSGGGTTKKTCESVSKNPISWIFCPLVKLLDGIISALDKGIQNLLIIDESNYNNEGVKNAWATMRNIALALLLPFMLVMVGGTALGAGPFDPYTVKRALPRLIFAAIYITISFPLTTFLVELSNAAGAGLMGIVSFAFTGANDDITLASLLSAGEAAEIFGSLIIGGGAVAAATLSVGVFASLALVAAGGLFIGYMILILRQVVILAAIILAPIAILSWIFPGNDKLWKLWRESFEKALLFFIIFMAILAMGRAFAYIVSQSGATSLAGPLKPFIIVVAYVGPYLLIRQIVSASGAALATLGGMVNDRSRGFFDRQRNWRQKERGRQWDRFKRGEKGGRHRRRIGEAVGAFAESDRKLQLATSMVRGKRGAADRRAAIAQQRKLNEMRHGQTETAKANKDNDPLLQAQTYTTEEQALQGLQDDWGMSKDEAQNAVAAARMAGGFSKARANYAARALAATGTGYEDIEQVQKTVGRIAESREEAADMLGEINAVTKGVGRNDLAPGFGAHMAAYDAAQARGGYVMGKDYLNGGADGTEATALYTKAAEDIDGVTVMRNKTVGVKNMAKGLAQSFQDAEEAVAAAKTSVERAEAKARLGELAGHINKIEQGGGYASATNSIAASKELFRPTSGQDQPAKTVVGPNGTPVQKPTAGRLAVAHEASRVSTKLNPTTQSLETIYQRTPSTHVTRNAPSGGNTPPGGSFNVDLDTGRPKAAPNPARTRTPEGRAIGRGYDATSPQTINNPYDPNRPG